MTDKPPRSSAEEPSHPERLAIGVITAAQGIRGEVRMQIWTHFPERIPELDHVYLDDAPEPRTLERARLTDKGAVLKLAGITTRNDAEVLRGTVIRVDLEQAAPLEEGEYYYFQLIGLAVVDEQGQALGQLTEIIETGANDVYVVVDEAKKELLIPAIEAFVLDVDLDAGRITVRPPEYTE